MSKSSRDESSVATLPGVRPVDPAEAAEIVERALEAGPTDPDVAAIKRAAQLEEEARQGFVTLSGGRRVQIQPIPIMLTRRLAEQIPDPPAPRVEVETVEGREVVENRNDPDWVAACEAAERRRRDVNHKALMLYGVDVEVPEEDAWMAVGRFLGLPEPADAFERKLLYIDTVVVRSTGDLTRLVRAVMSLSQASEEGIQAAEDRFRR